MSNDNEIKQWFSATHGANGNTTVTCSVQQGNLSAKWAVKSYPTQIQQGVSEARAGALKALADLQAALRTLSAVPALTGASDEASA